MLKYIYESHLGGLYTSDEDLDYDDLYCEECGDSDQLIGTASSREEAWNLLEDDTDINGSGGWDYKYVREFINSEWEVDRKTELLIATWKLLNKQNDSRYVLNMLEETVVYDDAECDGNCLMDDISAVLEEDGIDVEKI